MDREPVALARRSFPERPHLTFDAWILAVDGEKLMDMFERLELGLKPRTAYELDESFFEDFKK